MQGELTTWLLKCQKNAKNFSDGEIIRERFLAVADVALSDKKKYNISKISLSSSAFGKRTEEFSNTNI
jgi:hypothetical protein